MSGNPEVSIIIVNYNTSFHLRNCLNSIEDKLKSIGPEIIVIDNNSPDREIENFQQEFRDVKFFLRKENDGFGSGCNFGVKKASGRYLLFLNPDIILKDDSIILLQEYLENNVDCGIASGVLMDEKDSVIYFYNDFPSYLWEFYHLIGYGYDEKIKKQISKIEIKEERNFEVDWFHGAFLMMRKEDFEKIGGFNENYFMYYEDVEICYKSKNILNKKNICIPSVKVFHHTQSSLSEEKNDNIFIFHIQRGKIIFFRNYFFLKRYILHFTGLLYVLIRILFLPIWKKYNGRKKEKLDQLLKVLKLYISSSYLKSSKFEYIK